MKKPRFTFKKEESKAPDHVAIGASVRSARLIRRLSQKRLAIEVGITQPYLCDLECGRRKWNDTLFFKVVEALEAFKAKGNGK